jgi:predicted component of type VI protein secretion system
VILLVLRDRQGGLRIQIHPDLRAVVQTEDLDYIEASLRRCLQRAKMHPMELFKQLCDLAIGSLVTHEVGRDLAEFPSLAGHTSGFVELS